MDIFNQHDSRFNSIPQYMDWLLKRYRELQEAAGRQDIYRLVDINYTLLGKCKLKIQLLSSELCFVTTLLDVVRNDSMLIGFSRQDVRIITYLACEELYKPKFKIRLQRFRRQLNRTVFSIQDNDSGGLLEKTAAEIAADKEFLAKMSVEDSYMVGVMAGKESVKQKAIAEFTAKAGFESLTKREAECLVAILEGKTAKGTARDLGISPKSVESYVDNVKMKFDCYTRKQLFEKAFAAGLIDVISAEALYLSS